MIAHIMWNQFVKPYRVSRCVTQMMGSSVTVGGIPIWCGVGTCGGGDVHESRQ